MIEKVQESFKNLEYRVAGHDPGSLPELRSAAGEGGVQEAGVTPGDPHLDGAAPRVNLLVNSDLHHQVVLERGGGENKAMIELLRSLSSEDSDHYHHDLTIPGWRVTWRLSCYPGRG